MGELNCFEQVLVDFVVILEKGLHIHHLGVAEQLLYFRASLLRVSHELRNER